MCTANENTILAIVAIRSPSEKRDELCRALLSFSGPAEAQRGCTSWRLFQDVSDLNVFRVESRWTTQADLFRHIRSNAYKKFLQLMELGAEPPTIEFYAVSELRGMDLIKVAREPSNLPALR